MARAYLELTFLPIPPRTHRDIRDQYARRLSELSPCPTAVMKSKAFPPTNTRLPPNHWMVQSQTPISPTTRLHWARRLSRPTSLHVGTRRFTAAGNFSEITHRLALESKQSFL